MRATSSGWAPKRARYWSGVSQWRYCGERGSVTASTSASRSRCCAALGLKWIARFSMRLLGSSRPRSFSGRANGWTLRDSGTYAVAARAGAGEDDEAAPRRATEDAASAPSADGAETTMRMWRLRERSTTTMLHPRNLRWASHTAARGSALWNRCRVAARGRFRPHSKNIVALAARRTSSRPNPSDCLRVYVARDHCHPPPCTTYARLPHPPHGRDVRRAHAAHRLLRRRQLDGAALVRRGLPERRHGIRREGRRRDERRRDGRRRNGRRCDERRRDGR